MNKFFNIFSIVCFSLCLVGALYLRFEIQEMEFQIKSREFRTQESELRSRISRLELENSIIDKSYELAKDEIREWSNKRTYEEGLTDGLVRSGTTGYRDGYHAAMAQVEETKARLKEIKQHETKKDSEITPLTLQK